MWRTVQYGVTLGDTQLGSGMTSSPLQTKHISLWTTAVPLAAYVGDSYPHFTVCTVSTWCPCCLFVFLLHHIQYTTVGTQLAAYCPTSCKLKSFHTTSIRNNNRANNISNASVLQIFIVIGISLYTTPVIYLYYCAHRFFFLFIYSAKVQPWRWILITFLCRVLTFFMPYLMRYYYVSPVLLIS